MLPHWLFVGLVSRCDTRVCFEIENIFPFLSVSICSLENVFLFYSKPAEAYPQLFNVDGLSLSFPPVSEQSLLNQILDER